MDSRQRAAAREKIADFETGNPPEGGSPQDICGFEKSRKQRFSCGSGFTRPEPVEGQPRSRDLNNLNDLTN
jgi:hypothetical protein